MKFLYKCQNWILPSVKKIFDLFMKLLHIFAHILAFWFLTQHYTVVGECFYTETGFHILESSFWNKNQQNNVAFDCKLVLLKQNNKIMNLLLFTFWIFKAKKTDTIHVVTVSVFFSEKKRGISKQAKWKFLGYQTKCEYFIPKFNFS